MVANYTGGFSRKFLSMQPFRLLRFSPIFTARFQYMQFMIPVSQLAERPLAGCHKWLSDSYVNKTILTRALYTRLCLFTSISHALETYQVICEEFPGNSEYIINELQYEIRRASGKTSENYESELISRWAEVKMRVHRVDEVLEFVNQLKENRLIRGNKKATG